ncbi:hypothetical protein [Vibrio sp. HB161653]|uniref:hypothetical protein n=1 Tax=Vibrio sp. HB161653 TaxID=3068274 RepID=UPI00273FAB68|nr:hypothetical protein [Vibrio sp. HB161653]MDP5255117.1 hypothetical protein [Vibrio sp. HB161653]
MFLNDKVKAIKFEREKGRQLHRDMAMSLQKMQLDSQRFYQRYPLIVLTLTGAGLVLRKKWGAKLLSQRVLSTMKRLSSLV